MLHVFLCEETLRYCNGGENLRQPVSHSVNSGGGDVQVSNMLLECHH